MFKTGFTVKITLCSSIIVKLPGLNLNFFAPRNMTFGLETTKGDLHMMYLLVVKSNYSPPFEWMYCSRGKIN